MKGDCLHRFLPLSTFETRLDRVVELADTRRSERRAVRHGSSTLPLVTRSHRSSFSPGLRPGVALRATTSIERETDPRAEPGARNATSGGSE